MVEALLLASNKLMSESETALSTPAQVAKSQAIATYMDNNIATQDGFVGSIIQFSQIQMGVGAFSNGLLLRSLQPYGTVTNGVETPNFITAA